MAGTFDNLPVWTIPPDWSGGVLERLEWLTDVLTSSSGAEQRSSRRVSPRRTFETGLVAQGPERVLYGLQVKAAGASDWYVPLWHDIVRTSVAIVAGVGTEAPIDGVSQLRVPLSTSGHEYVAGGLVVLYSDVFTYEIAVIGAVLPAWLLLTVPTDFDWPAGTRLMPLLRGRLTTQPAGTRLTDGVLTSRVSFVATGPNPWPDSFGAYPTYKGFPVLTLAPNESESLSETYQRLTSVLDNLTGLTLSTDTAGFGFTAQQYRWFLSGLDEHTALRSLLYGLRGRLAPLWVPTFSSDLELVRPIAAADTTVLVARCGYTDYPTEGRSEIMFQLADGSQVFSTISASAVDGDTEVLGLATPVGRDLAVPFVNRISFMALCRQDSDAVEISHQTDTVGLASVATTFREAPDLRVSAWNGFNPADCVFAWLDNFDQTVNGTGHTLARGRYGKHSGKWYFEGYTPSQVTILGWWLGVCTLDATYAELNSSAVNGCLASSFSLGFAEAVCGTTVLSNDAGPVVTTMGFAVDLDNKRFWARPGPSLPWNSNPTHDPTTNVGGWDFSSLGDVDMYPCAVGLGFLWIINLGMRPFEGLIPGGFHPGWSAP